MIHGIQPLAQYGPMHGPGGGWGGGWFGFMPFGWFGILILIGIVVLIFALVRRGGHGDAGGPGTTARKQETAREVLDRRYAAGEITREEYQRMKEDLQA